MSQGVYCVDLSHHPLRHVVGRPQRSCLICGNRTRSLKHVGFTQYLWDGSVTPLVFCGDRCLAFANLLPEQALHVRMIKFLHKHEHERTIPYLQIVRQLETLL